MYSLRSWLKWYYSSLCLHYKDTIGKRRTVIMKQLGSAIVDFCVLLLGLFVAATLYRLPATIILLSRGAKARHRRIAVVLEFLYVWLDLFTLFAGFFVTITLYRLPKTIKKLREAVRN